jgi:hypothetical protein
MKQQKLGLGSQCKSNIIYSRESRKGHYCIILSNGHEHIMNIN